MLQAEIVILCVELFMTMESELPDLQPKKDTALAAEPACSENSRRMPFWILNLKCGSALKPSGKNCLVRWDIQLAKV